MSDSGQALGADLYQLQIAAKRNFPTVSHDFRNIEAHTRNTAAHDSAFHGAEGFGGGPPGGQVLAAWGALRDTFGDIMRETATSLELTADALLLAVSYYAAADGAARSELNRLMTVNGVPHPDAPQ